MEASRHSRITLKNTGEDVFLNVADETAFGFLFFFGKVGLKLVFQGLYLHS